MEEQEAEVNHTSDHILDWLGDSVSFFPSIFDDPYNPGNINNYYWWDQTQEVGQDLLLASPTSLNSTITAVSSNTTSQTSTSPTVLNHHEPSNSSGKGYGSDDVVIRTSQNYHHQRKKQSRQINEGEDAYRKVEDGKRSVGNNKKGRSKGNNNCNNDSNNKQGRWAEQLLNPCATAITAGNLTRVQHLLYVLHELASPTSDANHRLAHHGLKALTHHLSISSSSASAADAGPITFASTDARFFQQSLLKFYEVSPWFSFPNNIANSSILQIIDQEPSGTCILHILDIGVSHGVQWPILLEALTRRSGGPPSLVRITVVAAAATIQGDHNTETPFSVGPPGGSFYSRLSTFAKTLNINLEINTLDNHSLQSLNAQVINTSPEETLIVCTQFRLHHLNHNSNSPLDERTEFLKFLISLEPKGVILSENNMECSCRNCGDFSKGFSRRVEYLWNFLDSTSSAFKGRENEERRVMEGEAAKVLTNRRDMNETKDKWCERMRNVGFKVESFGEDTIDGGRALLRKYDNNWEMRVGEMDGCVGLWWKGQPVSFCSMWKLDTKS